MRFNATSWPKRHWDCRRRRHGLHIRRRTGPVADGLTRFLATRYDLEKSRAAAQSGAGWQPEIWRAFAEELGILGAALPEEFGGIGGGPVEMMLICEALGHALVIEPYVDSAVVASGLLRRAGGDVATTLLDEIVSGQRW